LTVLAVTAYAARVIERRLAAGEEGGPSGPLPFDRGHWSHP
jgi:hypothetical protein